MLHPICSLRARIPFLRLSHLSALASNFLEHDERNIFVFCFFIIFLSCRIDVQIFASAHHFAFFFADIIVAAAAVFAYFIDLSQTLWHISINIALFESSSSSSFQVFVFSL